MGGGEKVVSLLIKFSVGGVPQVVHAVGEALRRSPPDRALTKKRSYLGIECKT